MDPKRIILLDYQQTFVANLAERRLNWRPGRGYETWIAQETYRVWLLDLIRPEYVILITARAEKYRAATLARIAERADGWQPNEAYFNTHDEQPPASKERALDRYVFPRHGEPGKVKFLALESNRATRSMYSRRHIFATAVPYEPPVWAALPWPTDE